MNGYNFTERVRKALALAREEAVALHNDRVDTEHLLLGLLREGHGVANSVLSNLDVDEGALRDAVVRAGKKGDSSRAFGPDLPYASRAKHVLEQAMKEARNLQHSYVGTEHLLLGLLCETRSAGARALGEFGVTLDVARIETLNILGHQRPKAHIKGRELRHLTTSPVRVREVVGDAYRLATDVDSKTVTPVHMAIALLEHRDGLANTALQRLGFDVAAAIAQLRELMPHGESPLNPEQAITPSGELVQVMEAMDELAEEIDALPGTHHLLIALLRFSGDVASVFAPQNITVGQIQSEARRISG
jgi:ATP-dependent Clp protease ATP-binding subunit ClpA